DRHHTHAGAGRGTRGSDRILPQSRRPRELRHRIRAGTGDGKGTLIRNRVAGRLPGHDSAAQTGARTMNAQTAILQRDITPAGDDYASVRRVIEKISLDYREQPSLADLADELGETPAGLQKLFTRWAGLTPKAFLQAVTLDHARRLLDEGLPL